MTANISTFPSSAFAHLFCFQHIEAIVFHRSKECFNTIYIPTASKNKVSSSVIIIEIFPKTWEHEREVSWLSRDTVKEEREISISKNFYSWVLSSLQVFFSFISCLFPKSTPQFSAINYGVNLTNSMSTNILNQQGALLFWPVSIFWYFKYLYSTSIFFSSTFLFHFSKISIWKFKLPIS